MQRVREREALRIHGLSQNDALPETVLRFQLAMRCASEEDQQELRLHASLLQARLEAKGDLEEVTELERLLAEMGLEVESDPRLRLAGSAARQRLKVHATALRSASNMDPGDTLRAHLAANAWEADEGLSLPEGTRALVAYAGSVESCFVVVNHQDPPVGTGLISLKRADKTVALHGDSVTLPISRGKPKVVRLCVQGALQTNDTVHISVGGAPVFQQQLTVRPQDTILGSLRSAATTDVGALCQTATGHSARVVCAMAKGTP